MAIDAIYIATHRFDVHLTRICVASVRYWYEDIPIFLIKDRINGNFSTKEIEDVWNVGLYPLLETRFGWGMSKLEPIFNETSGKFLILDSDTVFAGKVLDPLALREEDFVVHLEQQSPRRISEIYFNVDELRRFDPAFVPPSKVFNTGQYVASGGRLKREDFDAVSWSTPPVVKYPNVFKNGEQGLLNYVLLKKRDGGEITLASVPLMRWPGENTSDIQVDLLTKDSPYEFVIHWAGFSRASIFDMPRADILLFFENFYYSRVRLPRLKRRSRRVTSAFARMTVSMKRRLGRP